MSVLLRAAVKIRAGTKNSIEVTSCQFVDEELSSLKIKLSVSAMKIDD